MSQPEISICLPNLNTARYLPERFESILSQTFTDWECVVSDNFSDDGSWEIIQSYAQRDPRIIAEQAPRDPQGMYPNWNNCLRRARGKFIYIATSDDTMLPDCLAELRDALMRHPECGIAHCNGITIDENGNAFTGLWEEWGGVKYFGDRMSQPHIRPPGHDTVVSIALYTPYLSITQVLFRRELLEKAGYFEGRWGSYGDLAWQMKATMTTSTVHVPQALATWRLHPTQASQRERTLADRRRGVFVEMAEECIDFSKRKGLPSGYGLPRSLRRYMVVNMWMEQPWRELSAWSKVCLLARRFATEPRAALLFCKVLRWRKSGTDEEIYAEVRHDIERLGFGSPQPA